MKINRLIYFSCTIGHSVQWNKTFNETKISLNDHCFCHTRCLLYYIPLTFHCTWTEKVAHQTEPTAFSTGQRHSCFFSSLKNHLTYSMYSLIFIQSLNLSAHFLPPPTPPCPPALGFTGCWRSPWIIMNRFGLLVGGGGATVTKASTSLYNLHTGYSGATLQFILKQARLTRRSIWRLITEGAVNSQDRVPSSKEQSAPTSSKKIQMVSGGGAKTWLGVWSLTWERYQWPSWQSCTKGPGSILWKSPKEIKEAAALEPQGPHWKWTNSQLTSCSECTITSTQSRLWGFLKVLQLGFHSHY